MKAFQFHTLLFLYLILFFIQNYAVTTPGATATATRTTPKPNYLPYDPWYTGPDYNDVEDAKTYAQKANDLSMKLTGKPMWIEPRDDLSFLDYHCVGAHNAHVYERWFNTVYQQRHSTTHMLTYGVRGLMWDTYNNDGGYKQQGPPEAKIIFAHGKPGGISQTQKGVQTTYQTMQYELRRVVEFMKLNPQAIITIILEDYAVTH